MVHNLPTEEAYGLEHATMRFFAHAPLLARFLYLFNESLQLSLILKFIIHCEKIDPVSNNGQLLNSYRFEIDLSA